MRWVVFALLALAGSAPAADRVVSLGGAVTEIVYALGEGGKLIAVDSTSTYPEAAKELPDVGYVRALSAEGILAMTPDLILASPDAGPPNVIEQLRAAGTEVVVVPDDPGLDGVDAKIRAVADALGLSEAGEKLAKEFDADRKLASEASETADVSAVYLMGRGDGVLLAAGRGTSADVMLSAAGLKNVVTEYEGYKPVSPESLIALGPEVIVTGERTVAGAGGLDKLKLNPAVAQTPASQAGRILVYDDLYLLGLGPRAAKAATELARAARE